MITSIIVLHKLNLGFCNKQAVDIYNVDHSLPCVSRTMLRTSSGTRIHVRVEIPNHDTQGSLHLCKWCMTVTCRVRMFGFQDKYTPDA